MPNVTKAELTENPLDQTGIWGWLDSRPLPTIDKVVHGPVDISQVVNPDIIWDVAPTGELALPEDL